MYTVSDLAQSVLIIDCADPGFNETPFVIDSDTITGNAFGDAKFNICNIDEVLLHFANPSLIPVEQQGKVKILCTFRENPYIITIALAGEVYVLDDFKYLEEKNNGSFASDSWRTFKKRLCALKL